MKWTFPHPALEELLIFYTDLLFLDTNTLVLLASLLEQQWQWFQIEMSYFEIGRPNVIFFMFRQWNFPFGVKP